MIPKELFRLNNGASIALCDRTVKCTGSYDLLIESGKVKPKALEPATYMGNSSGALNVYVDS